MKKRPINILYAEDELAHLELTKRGFLSLDLPCTIKHFSNGKELLDYLEIDQKEDATLLAETVLLIDLKMPIMGGVETLKNIKLNQQLKEMITIIFSTSKVKDEIEICRGFGCDGYFEKSFRPADIKILFEFIKETIAQRKARH